MGVEGDSQSVAYDTRHAPRSKLLGGAAIERLGSGIPAQAWAWLMGDEAGTGGVVFDLVGVLSRKGNVCRKPPASMRSRWRPVERWWLGVLQDDPMISVDHLDKESAPLPMALIGLRLYVFLG